MKPLVSIIIPIFNVEKYICDCLYSVVSQTYRPLDVILVDDRGTDNSMKLVLEFIDQHKDEGIRYSVVTHEKNRGLSVARNSGTQHASGDYVLYLDSDDQIVPNMVELSVSAALDMDSDFTICDYYSDELADKRGGHLLCNEKLVDGMEALKLFNRGQIGVSAWGKLIKRSFIEKFRLTFVEGIINEDEPWLFQMMLCAKKIALIHKALYYYRYNSNSIMSNAKIENAIRSNKIILDEFLKMINSNEFLADNKEVYLSYMRLFVLYFTRLVKHHKVLPKLNSFKYSSKYFKTTCCSIPKYYRLWNIAFGLPQKWTRLYLLFIIKLQNLK